MWSFILGTVLWVGVVTILTAGLLGLIIDVLSNAVTRRQVPNGVWEFRFKLVQLTALTTVIGAAIALPLTMARLRLTRRTNKTAEDALFNDKINEATKGLYARRQVSKPNANGTYQDLWEDDIVQRNAAIDRLEGLAKEDPKEVSRIARLLSVYVRELSKEFPPKIRDDEQTDNPKVNWARNLSPVRADMEKSVQTLGRLSRISDTPLRDGEFDLRGCNLQAFDLTGAQLEHCLLSGSSLQGAKLVEAQLHGSDLSFAQLEAAYLVDADLSEANLFMADLRVAALNDANLQNSHCFRTGFDGTNLSGALFQHSSLQGASFHGAIVKETWFQGAKMDSIKLYDMFLRHPSQVFDRSNQISGAALRNIDMTKQQISELPTDLVFGDASVVLPSGVCPGDDGWPPHWPDQKLKGDAFERQWRAWQETLPVGWQQGNA